MASSFTIERISEGYSAPDAEATIPIEIHWNKLLEWLSSRRKIPKDWKQRTDALQQRMQDASTDLPAVESLQSLRDSFAEQLSYFDCVRIRDALKVVEGEKRDLFRRYTSQRLADWDTLTREYEKDTVFLGEVAELLQNNLSAELPLLKKEQEKAEKNIVELDQKVAETNRAILRETAAFHRLCEEHGLLGINIREELLSLPGTHLPKLFEEIVSVVQSAGVRNAVQYYKDFVNVVLKASKCTAAEVNLRVLEVLIAQGNIGLLEFNPAAIVPAFANRVTDTAVSEMTVDAPAIVWDTAPAAAAADDSTQDTAADVGINWDGAFSTDVSAAALPVVEDSSAETTGQIDWGDVGGITLVNSGAVESSGAAQVTENSSTLWTILDDNTARYDFESDLQELHVYLLQRLHELSHDDTLSTLSSTQAPELQQHDRTAVQSYVVAVTKALELVSAPRLKQLVLLRSSARYVDRLAASVNVHLETSRKLSASLSTLAERRAQLVQNAASVQPKRAAVVRRTRQLQADIEATLTAQYKGRPVRIIGEMQQLSTV